MSKNPLAEHYKHFRVAERLLLTGHSHQAWPDVALEGQKQAFYDAALHVDDKWERANDMFKSVVQGYRDVLCDFEGSNYALGSNTQELVVRLLSGLNFRSRKKIVTTSGEFHSARILFEKLALAGFEIVKVQTAPVHTLSQRLSDSVDKNTLCCFVSAVFFETSEIVPSLNVLVKACESFDAVPVIDVYHALNVVPFELRPQNLENAVIVGGGYKYMQLGEGNCFLRYPKDLKLNPLLSGWFAEMYEEKMMGATYDPTSHYRANSVLQFFKQQNLTPVELRKINQKQIQILTETFKGLKTDPSLIDYDRNLNVNERGGFLSLKTTKATELSKKLKTLGVHTDARNEWLRFGPAPYLSDNQLVDSMLMLKKALTM